MTCASIFSIPAKALDPELEPKFRFRLAGTGSGSGSKEPELVHSNSVLTGFNRYLTELHC